MGVHRCCVSTLQKYRHTNPLPGDFPQPHRIFPHILVHSNRSFTSMGRIYTDESETATSCASAFLSGWVSGSVVHEHILSDKEANVYPDYGPLSPAFSGSNSITTPYHHQASGIIKPWHKTITAALLERCSTSNGAYLLPRVLL